MGDGPRVLRFHDEFMPTAPDELASAVSLALDPAGAPMVSIGVCWCGAPDEGKRVLHPLRAFGPPRLDTIGVIPYLVLQSAPTRATRGVGCISGSRATCGISPMPPLLELVPRMLSTTSGVGLLGLRGAASRVAPDALAFPHRAEQSDLYILAQWDDPRDSERNISWARDAFEAMRPHLDGGVYVNNLGAEGPDRVRAAYGTTSSGSRTSSASTTPPTSSG